jgi:hypothetical protein
MGNQMQIGFLYEAMASRFATSSDADDIQKLEVTDAEDLTKR